MHKILQLLITVFCFAVVAALVYFAGNAVLAGKTLYALLPTGILLLAILLYVRFSETSG